MKRRTRDTNSIITEIETLLEELRDSTGNTTGGVPSSTKKVAQRAPKASYVGVAGGIRLLIDEGFFNSPQGMPAVAEKLKKEGFNYRRQVISVALLRLVRSRALVRLPADNDSTEKWVYAVRK